MKLRNKTLLAIVATFSCLSLFCVGFANWAVGQGATSVTGTISAEDVKESSYFLEVAPPTDLVYTVSGFSAESPYTGTVTVPVTLHLNAIAEVFGAGEATLTVTMQYLGEAPSDSIFLQTGGTPETHFVTGKFAENTALSDGKERARTADALSVETTVNVPQIDSATPDLTLSAVFTISFPDAEAYATYFFTPLQNNVAFAFSAAIEGGAA